jgi:hypothetical protein
VSTLDYFHPAPVRRRRVGERDLGPVVVELTDIVA